MEGQTASEHWISRFQESDSENALRSQNTHAIDTRVVGVTYDNRQAIVAQLRAGEQLQLCRDPHNPYDSNAVKVVRSNGQQVGFISQSLAAQIAPIMDRYSQSVTAIVTAIVGGKYSGDFLGVRIRFSLPEAPQIETAEDLPYLPDIDEIDSELL